MRAANMHELRLAWETRNMIHSDEKKLRASLMRTESRCRNYRFDYPEVVDVDWRTWINIFQGADGSMQLEKQPFDTWPDQAFTFLNPGKTIWTHANIAPFSRFTTRRV